MPFLIQDDLFYEDISLTQAAFYEKLTDPELTVSTSQPAIGDIVDLWDSLIAEV